MLPAFPWPKAWRGSWEGRLSLAYKVRKERFPLETGAAMCSVKVQAVTILGFAGHAASAVTSDAATVLHDKGCGCVLIKHCLQSRLPLACRLQLVAPCPRPPLKHPGSPPCAQRSVHTSHTVLWKCTVYLSVAPVASGTETLCPWWQHSTGFQYLSGEKVGVWRRGR